MSDRISSMVAETNSEMSAESSEASESKSIGSVGRLASIMDMDYSDEDDSTEEPEDNKIENGQTPAKASPKEEKEDTKEEEKVEVKDVVEEKEPEEVKPPSDKKLIKYKVDGQDIEEEVSEKDLINNYSGQKALQRRFTELDKDKKEFVREREHFVKNNEFFIGEIEGVKTGFTKVVEDFKKSGYVNGNPLDTVYNLLDKLNVDASSYDKAMFFHYIPEVSKFLDMSDEGRDAYLLKKENEWFQKKHNKLDDQRRANLEERQRFEAENSIKQQYGVTEERFSELKSELVDKFNINPNDLTTEKIIGWSLEKPAYDRAIALIEKAGADTGGAFKLAEVLYKYPHTTDDEVLTAMGYKDKQAKQLVQKLGDKVPPKALKKTVESSDYDQEFFKTFRRR